MMLSQEDFSDDQEIELLCSWDFEKQFENLSKDKPTTARILKIVTSNVQESPLKDHQIDIKPRVEQLNATAPPLEELEIVFLPAINIKTEVENFTIDIKSQDQLQDPSTHYEKAKLARGSVIAKQDLYLRRDFKTDVEELPRAPCITPLPSTSLTYGQGSNASTVTSSVNMDLEFNQMPNKIQHPLPPARWLTSKPHEFLHSSTGISKLFSVKDLFLVKPVTTETTPNELQVDSSLETSSYVECFACKLRFRGSVYLAKHIKHDCKLICKHCSKVFDSAANLAEHMKADCKFICKYCPRVFDTQLNMKRHMQSHLIIKCDLCNKTFPDKSAWRNHFKAGVLRVEGMYSCTICDRSMKWVHHFKSHLKAHARTAFTFLPRNP